MGLSGAAPWVKFYGNTPATLRYPNTTMYQQVAAAAARFPHHIAYRFLGKQTTYQGFMQRIDAAAGGLTQMGLVRGDRITICMPNTPQALDCFYACNRIGVIPNIIHPLSAPKEIVFYLNISRSKAILTLDQFYHKVASILPELEAPCEILIARVKDELPFPKSLLYPFTKGGRHPLPTSGYTLWSSLISAGKDTVLPADRGQSHDCGAILYSGGTTGTTKGILLTNLNFNALALQTIAASGYPSVDGMKMLAVMPLFHGFGLGIGIHAPLISGGTCILVPQFSMKVYTDILLKQQPDFIPGVPTLFEALLRAEALKNADLSFLKGIFCGGDSLSPDLKQRVDAFLKDHGCTQQIREGYGTTECVAASCLTPKDYARKGSIGVPFPDTFYKIVKPNTTQALDPGAEGEICLRGPTVMEGYMDDPEETSQVLRRHSDGQIWLHTGDLGHMDEDGFLYFHQRLKRMIVTSGYNVYPSQLEHILNRHEKVMLSCVIGVKDPYRIQKIKAYIVPMPDVAPTEALKQELFAYCQCHIAKYAMPREIEFRTDLPKTPVGKVAYRVLEEEANKKEGNQ